MTTTAANLATDIRQAAARLDGIIVKTPLQYSQRLSDVHRARVFLKREDLQLTGSYKIRGAYNLMASLQPGLRSNTVATASTGNHAQAVAEAARRLGLVATIFVPQTTPLTAQAAIRRTGGTATAVIAAGTDLAAALAIATTWAHQHGALLVHPYDDPSIVAGQGSMAVEIANQLAAHQLELDTVLAPLGGGGLVSGLGSYLQAASPNTELIAVRPSQATGVMSNLKAGGRNQLAQAVVGRTLEVTEPAVLQTMLELDKYDGVGASAAGALATAALPQLTGLLEGQTVVVIVSGR